MSLEIVPVFYFFSKNVIFFLFRHYIFENIDEARRNYSNTSLLLIDAAIKSTQSTIGNTEWWLYPEWPHRHAVRWSGVPVDACSSPVAAAGLAICRPR